MRCKKLASFLKKFQAVHKAVIKVNEEGSEASAETGGFKRIGVSVCDGYYYYTALFKAAGKRFKTH